MHPTSTELIRLGTCSSVKSTMNPEATSAQITGLVDSDEDFSVMSCVLCSTVSVTVQPAFISLGVQPPCVCFERGKEQYACFLFSHQRVKWVEDSASSDNNESLIGFLAVVVPALLSITWTRERTSQETGVLYLFPKCHLLIAIG